MADDETFRNPVDRKTYVAPGGWKTYQPPNRSSEEPGRKVRTGDVRLLTSLADIAARTKLPELAALFHEAERLADVSFGTSGRRFRIMVQFTCRPTGHEVDFVYQGDAPMELLQGYYKALVAIKRVPVTEGEVSFQFELSVSP